MYSIKNEDICKGPILKILWINKVIYSKNENIAMDVIVHTEESVTQTKTHPNKTTDVKYHLRPGKLLLNTSVYIYLETISIRVNAYQV